MNYENFLRINRRLKIVFLCGFFFLSSSQAAQAQSAKLFDAPSHIFDTGRINEGASPNSLAIGDLDGDGDKDAVINTMLGMRGIAVMRNNGDKTFEKTVNYALPTGNNSDRPYDVKLYDFDSDGDLDVLAAVSNPGTNDGSLYVWRNNGNATFAAPMIFPAFTDAQKMIVADFTGDGFSDVAIANFRASNNFTRLIHNGQTGSAAGYGAPVTTTVGSGFAEDIRAADLNGDNRIDLILSVSDIYVLFNNGNNTFAAPVIYNPAPNARYKGTTLAARDMDNDGDVDLIGSGFFDIGSQGISYGAYSILRNNGSGVFGTAEIFNLPLFTFLPKDLKTADFNGDGFADIVATNPSGRTPEGWVLLLSNGQGGFQESKLFSTGQWTYAIDASDADGDGDADVLTVSRDSNALAFFENKGGSVPFAELTLYQLVSANDATESADIDNDGDIDIVTNNETDLVSNQGLVMVQKNNGNGTFAAPVSYSQPRDYFDLKLRDLNNDGFVDMVFGPDGDAPPYHLGFALNRGDGRFFPTVVLNMGSCGEGTVDAFDLDNDGNRDIVFTEEQACAGGTAKRIFIYRNDGSGTFVNVRQIPFLGGPKDLGGADLDGDGKIDLVTIHTSGIAFLKNLGNFNFAEPVISPGPAGINLYLFKLADLNRDGKLDVGTILNQDYFYARIGTMKGNGDGTFAPIQMQLGATTAESLRSAADIDIADVNGDLYPDLNITNYASNDVSIFLTNPDGSPRPQQRYGIGNTPSYSTVADFNGDGKADIASVVATNLVYRDYLVILSNIAPSARKSAFDFDGDGKADISIFRPTGGEWWMQRSSGGIFALQFGSSTDRIVPADYTGDGKTDVAVWRPASGEWFILRSEDSSFYAFPFGT